MLRSHSIGYQRRFITQSTNAKFPTQKHKYQFYDSLLSKETNVILRHSNHKLNTKQHVIDCRSSLFNSMDINSVSNFKKTKNNDQKYVFYALQKRSYYYQFVPHYPESSWLSFRTRRRLRILIIFLLILAIFIFFNLEEAPVTGRKRLMLISPERDRELGEQTIREFLHSVGRQHVLPPHHPTARMVRQIGLRIVDALEQDDETAYLHPGEQDLPSIPTSSRRKPHKNRSSKHISTLKSRDKWRFYVVDSPEINAFCAPGGDIVIFSGLLDYIDNQDQLASVLSHEISHAIARHGAEQLSIRSILAIFQLLSANLFDLSIHMSGAALDIAIAKPYSRLMEKEADTIGIKLMAKACFDPRAAPIMMKKLAQLEEGHPRILSYLSTHPSNQQRIADLYSLEPEAYDILLKNCNPKHPRMLMQQYRPRPFYVQ